MNIKNSSAKKFKDIHFIQKYLEIEGGKLLEGNIKISGAKNSALVLMAASILSKDQINLFNVPRISDVIVMSKILAAIGINIKLSGNQLKIRTKEINLPSQELFFDLFNSLRASFFCIGPLLARFGKAKVPLPGGCSIGSRPIDEHINSLKELGVIFEFKNSYLNAEVNTPDKKLH